MTSRPPINQFRQHTITFFWWSFSKICLNHFFQLFIFVHGNMQVRNIAKTLYIRHCCNFFRNCLISQIAGLCFVKSKPNICGFCRWTICFNHLSTVGNLVSCCIFFGYSLGIKINSRNVKFIQFMQFSFSCTGIRICISPDSQFLPNAITLINQSIMIAIILSQGFITMCCRCAIRE